MLVLTRKPDQRIWIGDDVCILVSSIQGNKVRLGIEAPHGVTILREELKRKDEECGGTTAQEP